jgi:hypothetical protein
MNGWILFGIGIASLAIIAFALAYLGLRGWRLAKHAIGVSRHIAPLAAELAGRADEAGRAAERLSADAADLTADLERMQRSLQRLKILTDAWDDAVAPIVRIAEYLGT